MALNTDYVYNVDKKYAKISFHDNSNNLSFFEYNDSVITVSELSALAITPFWGTNKDIIEWLNCIESMSGRLELNHGAIRDGYEYELKVNEFGVDGIFEANKNTLGDWGWVSSAGVLAIAERDECEISFAEFKSYVQWMRHFQYVVQNYGG